MPIGSLPVHVLTGGSHVLRGGRFMVDVAGVDVGAVVQQESGDLDSGREVKWELAVATAGMNEFRGEGQELADAADHTEPCGRMDIDSRTTRNEVFRKLGAGGI
jgi:hypothetical protein